MALPLYLAMTAGEFDTDALPPLPAYMACHFSVYGKGLQDLPTSVPAGCLLILDDRIPVWEHDPGFVASQLRDAVEKFQCSGLLLDFQRPGEPLMADITRRVADLLPCPVAVTEAYAEDVGCAVLLDTPKANEPLTKCIQAWPGREWWLEIAPEVIRYTVTKDASTWEEIQESEQAYCHQDAQLCCSYRIDLQEDRALFTIGRTWEDLQKLMAQAEELGVQKAIGLYQQLCSMVTPDDGWQRNKQPQHPR